MQCNRRKTCFSLNRKTKILDRTDKYSAIYHPYVDMGVRYLYIHTFLKKNMLYIFEENNSTCNYMYIFEEKKSIELLFMCNAEGLGYSQILAQQEALSRGSHLSASWLPPTSCQSQMKAFKGTIHFGVQIQADLS